LARFGPVPAEERDDAGEEVEVEKEDDLAAENAAADGGLPSWPRE